MALRCAPCFARCIAVCMQSRCAYNLKYLAWVFGTFSIIKSTLTAAILQHCGNITGQRDKGLLGLIVAG